MMKIIHIRDKKEVDITELVTEIKWSGDSKQVARVLSFGIVSSPTDKNIPVLNLKLGDMVKLLNGKLEKYRGYVFTKEKSLSGSQIDITSYDGLIYLLKSKGTYNFKNVTPGDIVRKVAKDFGIEIGTVINGSGIKRIFDAEEIYNIIMTAYTMESNKTKKQYIPLMDKGKLNVLEKGMKTVSFELDPSNSIIDAKYSESMENSINAVKIYDEDGEYVGEVNLTGIPGRLQDVYKGNQGEEGGRSLLKGIEKTASLEAIGDWDCTTGNAVKVKEKHTGLVGLFYIDSDEHIFANGQHMMTLGLAFQNIMDKQMAGEDPDTIDSYGGSGTSTGGYVTGTGKERIWNFFKSKGASDEFTAGVMGNLQQESGLDPTKFQYGSGPGRGLMQWTVGSNRFKSLEALAKKQGKTWKDLNSQLDFIWHELYNESTAVNKLKRKYNMSPHQLTKIKDVNNATRIFEDCYERAGKPNYPQRERYANNIYNEFKGGKTQTGGGGNSKRNKFIAAAESMIGFNYSQANRMGPRSADCSSLVGRAMKMAGITSNSYLTTVSILTDNRFVKIAKSEAKRGDILLETGHMAIYMGNNTTLEARYSTKKVGYSSLGNRFSYAYRIKGI